MPVPDALRTRYFGNPLADWLIALGVALVALVVLLLLRQLVTGRLRAIAAREGALAILPAGSLEQHGPHLPVITDTASASAAAVAAARLVANEVPVAVLPGLWLGLSEHHLPFGGTISVGAGVRR